MADLPIPARPTTYQGIQMRSRLEAGFASWLDDWEFEWTYEPKAFAGPTGQYLPDFRLESIFWIDYERGKEQLRNSTAYVEVKPERFADLDRIAEQMLVIRESEPETLLILATACDSGGGLFRRLWDSHWDARPGTQACKWMLTDWVGPAGRPLLLPTPWCRRLLAPWPDRYWAVN